MPSCQRALQVWFFFILVSAMFSALSMVAIKLGVTSTEPILASAINTIVVLIVSWIVALTTGACDDLASIDARTLVFLILAGTATGGVGIANYCALKIGDVDTYLSVVRCSMVLTVVLSYLLLGEPFTLLSGAGTVFILVGSILMTSRRSCANRQPLKGKWAAYMVIAIVLSSAATLLGKVGISNVNSNLGTAMFSIMVFILSNSLAFATGKWKQAPLIPRKELLFILLAGLASAGTELTFYAGLKLQLTSIVMPVDKLLSGVFTVGLAYLVFNETVNRRAAIALCLVGLGSAVIML